jgi:hypothetical protein
MRHGPSSYVCCTTRERANGPGATVTPRPFARLAPRTRTLIAARRHTGSEPAWAQRLVGPSALPRRVECGHQSIGRLPATADVGLALDEPPLLVGRLERAHGVPCRRGRLIELPQRFGDHRAVPLEGGDRGSHCCPDVGRHQVSKIARLGHGQQHLPQKNAQRSSAFRRRRAPVGRTDAAAAGRASTSDELPEKGERPRGGARAGWSQGRSAGAHARCA